MIYILIYNDNTVLNNHINHLVKNHINHLYNIIIIKIFHKNHNKKYIRFDNNKYKLYVF